MLGGHPGPDQRIDGFHFGGQRVGQQFMGLLRIHLVHSFPDWAVVELVSRQSSANALTSMIMKELLRSSDPTILAFATALLDGEDIDGFQMDVNMSILEGGIGIFPRRLLVRTEDHTQALRVMRDNGIATSDD